MAAKKLRPKMAEQEFAHRLLTVEAEMNNLHRTLSGEDARMDAKVNQLTDWVEELRITLKRANKRIAKLKRSVAS